MIHELIKSMSQSEKRHFKLHASRMHSKEELPLLNLFDLIAKQDIYDEKRIKVAYGSVFFAQKKNKLYKKLMDSLKSFHKEDDANTKLDGLLVEFRILKNKSLYKQAKKKLEKAKKVAIKYELFTELIRVKQVESELYVASSDTQMLDIHIHEMRQEAPEIMQLINSKQNTEKAYLVFTKTNNEREFVRNNEELNDLKASASQIIEIDLIDKSSFQTKNQFHYAKGLYYYLTGDFNESLYWFIKQVAAFHERPYFCNEFNLEYLKALANTSLLSIQTGSEKQFFESYKALESSKSKTKHLNNQISFWLYSLHFLKLTSDQHYEEAKNWINLNKHAKVLEEKFKIDKMLVTERNLMVLGKIKTYMMLKDYKTALRSVNDFLNQSADSNKQDTYIFIRFLFLILQREIVNIGIVENGLRSLRIYLKGKKRLFLFEKTTLIFIQKLCEALNTKDEKVIFGDYQKKLFEFKLDSFERNATVNFNLIDWIELKLERAM